MVQKCSICGEEDEWSEDEKGIVVWRGTLVSDREEMFEKFCFCAECGELLEQVVLEEEEREKTKKKGDLILKWFKKHVNE